MFKCPASNVFLDTKGTWDVKRQSLGRKEEDQIGVVMQAKCLDIEKTSAEKLHRLEKGSLWEKDKGSKSETKGEKALFRIIQGREFSNDAECKGGNLGEERGNDVRQLEPGIDSRKGGESG